MFSTLALISVAAGLAAIVYGLALVYLPLAYVFSGITAIRFAGRLVVEAKHRAPETETAESATADNAA